MSRWKGHVPFSTTILLLTAIQAASTNRSGAAWSRLGWYIYIQTSWEKIYAIKCRWHHSHREQMDGDGKAWEGDLLFELVVCGRGKGRERVPARGHSCSSSWAEGEVTAAATNSRGWRRRLRRLRRVWWLRLVHSRDGVLDSGHGGWWVRSRMWPLRALVRRCREKDCTRWDVRSCWCCAAVVNWLEIG